MAELTDEEKLELFLSFNFFLTPKMMDTEWHSIFEFFGQTKLTSKIKEMIPDEWELSHQGICFGLTMEFTRYLMKHEKDPDPVGDFCEKIDRELNEKDGKNPTNFLTRLLQYQAFQSSPSAKMNNLSVENDFSQDIAPDYISACQSDLNKYNHIGIVMVRKGGAHEISVHKIGEDYVVLDPNRGMAKFSGNDAVNRCNRIIFLLHKSGNYTENKYHNLGEIVRDNFSNHGFEKFFRGTKEGKQRKYVKRNEDINNKLVYTSFDNNVNTVKKYLDMGANPNSRDYRRVTPLHIAVTSANPEIINLLIDRGANVNATFGADDLSPLMLATLNREKEVVKTLIDRGASVNMKDPMLFSIASNGDPEIRDLLISASNNAKTSNLTPPQNQNTISPAPKEIRPVDTNPKSPEQPERKKKEQNVPAPQNQNTVSPQQEEIRPSKQEPAKDNPKSPNKIERNRIFVENLRDDLLDLHKTPFRLAPETIRLPAGIRNRSDFFKGFAEFLIELPNNPRLTLDNDEPILDIFGDAKKPPQAARARVDPNEDLYIDYFNSITSNPNAKELECITNAKNNALNSRANKVEPVDVKPQKKSSFLERYQEGLKRENDPLKK
ncbi:MAG: ankyrin repeat domain-containing protein [Rickettsiaceae bacterium]|nr:ankyrin repeat domain-containing protein [Rickettsiaceae bacterium]